MVEELVQHLSVLCVDGLNVLLKVQYTADDRVALFLELFERRLLSCDQALTRFVQRVDGPRCRMASFTGAVRPFYHPVASKVFCGRFVNSGMSG